MRKDSVYAFARYGDWLKVRTLLGAAQFRSESRIGNKTEWASLSQSSVRGTEFRPQPFRFFAYHFKFQLFLISGFTRTVKSTLVKNSLSTGTFARPRTMRLSLKVDPPKPICS